MDRADAGGNIRGQHGGVRLCPGYGFCLSRACRLIRKLGVTAGHHPHCADVPFRGHRRRILSVLLGLPPQSLQERFRETKKIPAPPTAVAVGIPADLLRRRPDIRRAERQLAAQSAEIGIAQADLFPQFSLFGTLSVTAEEFPDLFTSAGLNHFLGPGFRWAILHYGRIQNNVRVQDARFQALMGEYKTTVLQAQQEVADALAGYLGTQRQVTFLTSSVESATRAVELADFQYREGATDYTRVLTTQQFLVNARDRLVATRGAVALNLVTQPTRVGSTQKA